MAAEPAGEAQGAQDPAGVLGDEAGLDALDAEIARVRAREERRALGLLRRAGHFGVRIGNAEFDRIYRDAFLAAPRRPSALARLEARRDAQYAGRRARDARRKALLGGFVVAQCRHRPAVHAALAPDIREWLLSHRSGKVGERNAEALSGFLADPAHKGLAAPPADSSKAGRERTHRLILLGAWVLARREELGDLRGLVAAELAGFLDQGRRAERNKALLRDVLGR